VDVMVKHHGGWTYVLAVAMRDGATEATFTLPTSVSGRVDVIGEDREISVDGGTFRDTFAGYDVHLYRVPTGWWLDFPWLGRHRLGALGVAPNHATKRYRQGIVRAIAA
jgi:hypothetical protein